MAMPVQQTPYLIDWLTLRCPLGHLGPRLIERIRECLNTIHCVDREGQIVWTKQSLDVDALRSDTPGLVWMVQSDGKQEYLAIGGSPASIEHGINVFGSCDIQHAASVLVQKAGRVLNAILPRPDLWQCRRIDITGNFVLPDFASCKQALRQLCLADGGRRKATNDKRGGDSVYWNPTSDLAKGKAYHKGPHLAHLARKGLINIGEDLVALADRIIRLEHTRGARWFRRLAEAGRHWYDLTLADLEGLFVEFFGRVVDGVEVNEMERHELVARIAQCSGITQGRAEAAFATYRNIRADGFEVTKDYMPSRTWYLHLKYLRAAGISDADLQQGNVVQFRPVRIVLAQPVTCWEDIRRVA
jgi:II/X family phage/plasmid replication protein